LFANEDDFDSLNDSSSFSSEDETFESKEETHPCESNLLMLRRLLETISIREPTELEQSQ